MTELRPLPPLNGFQKTKITNAPKTQWFAIISDTYCVPQNNSHYMYLVRLHKFEVNFFLFDYPITLFYCCEAMPLSFWQKKIFWRYTQGKNYTFRFKMLPMSKQPSGVFSIDSIINTTRRETSREDSPLSRNNVDNPRPNLGTRSELSAINGRIPPLHPALPLHVRNLLLAGETTRSLPPDVFHYGQSWPLHNSSLPSISTLARSLPQYTEPCLNAGFPGLWPQVSEQMAFLNPWLVTRGTQSLLGLPLGMLFVFFSFREMFWYSI